MKEKLPEKKKRGKGTLTKRGSGPNRRRIVRHLIGNDKLLKATRTFYIFCLNKNVTDGLATMINWWSI